MALFPCASVPTEQTFRPIHYLGSKLRILENIRSVIDEVDPTGGRVCDLFAGSGTVSSFLAQSRPITSVDIQEYSRVLCSALLNPMGKLAGLEPHEFVLRCKGSAHFAQLLWCMEPMLNYETTCVSIAASGDPIPLCELVESGSLVCLERGAEASCSSNLATAARKTTLRLMDVGLLQGPEAMVCRYFGGPYFSHKQAIQLDALLDQVFRLDERYRDTFLAAVLSTASDIVNTVGKQFAQPLRTKNADGTPKRNIVARIMKDRTEEPFSVFERWLQVYLNQETTPYETSVYRMDYSDALDMFKTRAGDHIRVVYADPPYTRYHYSRYYHVLETICLRDNPSISKTCRNGGGGLSRGVYREDRHQSPFSIKTQAGAAFDDLFRKVRRLDAALVLSYSPFDSSRKATPRVQSIEQLEKMARRYFGRVETISVGEFSHSKLNSSEHNFDISYDAERIMICQA